MRVGFREADVEFSDPSDDWQRIVSNEARLAKAPWWKGAETMPGLGPFPVGCRSSESRAALKI
jgi:hypothetical protein